MGATPINPSGIPVSGSVSGPTPVSGPAGPYALYTPQAIGLATLLGSPLAGTIFMAINYRRLGKTGAAAGALALGLLVTAIGIALGMAISSSGTTGIGIGLFAATFYAAKSLQGPAVEQHKAAGGKIGSLWNPFAVGMVFLIPMLSLYIFSILSDNGTRIAFVNNDIYYKGTATEADARALAGSLREQGYFDNDHRKTVLLNKSPQGTTIGFVIDPAAIGKPGIMPGFAKVTAIAGTAVGGTPLSFKLVDPNMKELKSMVVSAEWGTRVAFGINEIYYKGDATQRDANALADAFENQKFFDGIHAKSVFLSKSPQGTVISFTYNPEAINNPEVMPFFAKLTTAVGAAAGPKPLTFKLVDSNLKELKSQTLP